MKQALRAGILPFLLSGLVSCAGLQQLQELPEGTLTITGATFSELPGAGKPLLPGGLQTELELTDSSLVVEPLTKDIPRQIIPLSQIEELQFTRRSFDVDILTIPFKVRPSVKGFPEQLNAGFSAALYAGRRTDHYRIRKVSRRTANPVQVNGVGLGYGAFLGIGSVTMNPFVTQNQIDYEYDGFVLTAGLAGILDVKKINLGLAFGADRLVDKNRRYWIYQHRPWAGILFGINLN